MESNQNDTRYGELPFKAGEDLTGKEGHLVKLTDGGTKAQLTLPTNNSDPVLFVVTSGAASGDQAKAVPFAGAAESNRNVRSKGTGNAGDRLVLADVATAADKGKVRALPATSGTYRVIAIAEEDFVDGQFVRTRPFGPIDVVVP